jgi:uncharacterized membrane protein YhaH (DUF805 family)
MDLSQVLKSLDWNYLLTSFEGRIPRLHFWIGAIAVGVAGGVASFVLGGMLGFIWSFLGQLVSAVIALACLYPQYALMVKRGHDRGRPDIVAQAFCGVVAVMILLGLVPFLGLLVLPLSFVVLIASIALLVDYGILPGVAGSNQYGPDPLATRA